MNRYKKRKKRKKMLMNNKFAPQFLFDKDGPVDDDIEFVDDEGSDFQDDFKKDLDHNKDPLPKDDDDDYEDEADLEDDDDVDPTDEDEDDEEDDEEEDDDEEDEDEDSEDEDEEEKPDLVARQAKLLKVIEELSGGLDLNDVQAGEIVEQQFVSDEDFKNFEAAESADEMNKIFNKVYKKIILVSDRRANMIAGSKLTHQVQTAETTDTFYRNNPELADVKELVLAKAKTIFSKSDDKDLTLADLLDKAGTEVREALGLKKGSKSKEDKKSTTAKKDRSRKPPRMPKARGGGRSKKRTSSNSKKTGLEAELEMFANHNKRVRSL
jgi:hypothetical protein